jgi:hypothetical protein
MPCHWHQADGNAACRHQSSISSLSCRVRATMPWLAADSRKCSSTQNRVPALLSIHDWVNFSGHCILFTAKIHFVHKHLEGLTITAIRVHFSPPGCSVGIHHGRPGGIIEAFATPNNIISQRLSYRTSTNHNRDPGFKGNSHTDRSISCGSVNPAALKCSGIGCT